MRTLVVGYGSIGSRHARILEELGCQVAVVSVRELPVACRFGSIVEAVREFAPEYVVLATDTARHLEGIAELRESGFRGRLLVEKPFSRNTCEMPEAPFAGMFVAYNLRFHPLCQRLHELLKGETVLSVQAYVGQYLPTWRPGRDYREVYSADRKAGGGVLRDLSHELDLLNWLLGGWQALTAQGGHFSHLEITSDDIYSIMMTTARCPVVSVQMNYLDRPGRRCIIVNTDLHSLEINFIAGKLTVDGVSEEFPVERDYTYRQMHLAVIEGGHSTLCTLDEGLDVMRMITAAELAVEEGVWVAK